MDIFGGGGTHMLLYFKAIFIKRHKVSLPGCYHINDAAADAIKLECYIMHTEVLFPSVIIKVHKVIVSHCMVQLPPAACNSGVPHHQTG